MTGTDWSQYEIIISETSEAKRLLTNSPQRKVAFFAQKRPNARASSISGKIRLAVRCGEEYS